MIRSHASMAQRSAVIFTSVLFILFHLMPSGLLAETRPADEVFKKWKSWQYVYEDEKLAEPSFDDPLKVLIHHFPEGFRERARFLGLRKADFELSPDSNRGGDRKRYEEANLRLQKSLRDILTELDHNMPAFAARLDKSGFGGADVNEKEKSTPTREMSSTYRSVFESLMQAAGVDGERQMFALGNRLFEYAFGEKNGASFLKMLETPEKYPQARLLYATIWYRLSGNGWRIWHRSTLDALRKETEAGREVVYIAGGTDFYHLIRAGVTRIRIIDPILPSQTKYYSEGWDFLVGCHEGDEIPFAEAGIVLKRSGCKDLGKFQTGELSDGSRQTIPRSIVEWKIIGNDGISKGYVIYERRFAKQEDFRGAKDRVLLISFNELAYVTDAGSSGWGMDPEKWPADLKLYVKQLRRPIGRTECVLLKQASVAPFSFIRLGTSVL